MAYTDAPIIALGDDPCVRAPIRAIQVMSYDGEDECWVKILGGDGMGTTIKADRIYKNPVRFRQKAARLDFDELLS